VWFIYPETSGVRLEDMDRLFGDATTAMPTPAQNAEVDSLMGGRPRIPSLDIRGGRPSPLDADSAIPGLDIDPPNITVENGRHQSPAVKGNASQSEGFGGWITRMINRSKGDGRGTNGQSGQYRRVDQDEG